MRRAMCCCRRSFMTAQAGAILIHSLETGIAAHIAFAEPISTKLRNLLADSARSLGVTVHNGGTYVNMDGPAFSTRAESEFNHRNGFDVIAMTNLPEAKLAREAEIAFATMAMITDYDCWKVEEEPVSAEIVLSHLMANAETARKIIVDVIPQIPTEPDWPEHFALNTALITDRKLWPEATIRKAETDFGAVSQSIESFPQQARRLIISHNASIWASSCAAVTVIRNRAAPLATVG